MAIISGINVPKDVIRSVFQNLDPASLRECSKVCKVFREIALNENFLKSLFPNVTLPKGMTIQQWLLQSIHNEKDLLKCLTQFAKKRGTEKEKISLKLSSASGESILVNFYVCNTEPSNPIQLKIIFYYQILEPEKKELPGSSVILGNVNTDFDIQTLGAFINTHGIGKKRKQLPATKPAPSRNTFAMGAATAALSIAAVVGRVFFSKSNNE